MTFQVLQEFLYLYFWVLFHIFLLVTGIHGENTYSQFGLFIGYICLPNNSFLFPPFLLLIDISSTIRVVEIDEDHIIDHFIEKSIFPDPHTVVSLVSDIWFRIDSLGMMRIESYLWHFLIESPSYISVLIEEFFDFFREFQVMHIYRNLCAISSQLTASPLASSARASSHFSCAHSGQTSSLISSSTGRTSNAGFEWMSTIQLIFFSRASRVQRDMLFLQSERVIYLVIFFIKK